MEDQLIERGHDQRGGNHDLIASNRVEGTTVYGKNGDKLGRIENFMVGKRNGQVEYAVLSFGGFLGMGHDHYPLPWKMLDYDPSMAGYVVDLTREQLEGAPRYGADAEPSYDEPYGRRVHEYYGMGYPMF